MGQGSFGMGCGGRLERKIEKYVRMRWTKTDFLTFAMMSVKHFVAQRPPTGDHTKSRENWDRLIYELLHAKKVLLYTCGESKVWALHDEEQVQGKDWTYSEDVAFIVRPRLPLGGSPASLTPADWVKEAGCSSSKAVDALDSLPSFFRQEVALSRLEIVLTVVWVWWGIVGFSFAFWRYVVFARGLFVLLSATVRTAGVPS